MDTPEKVVKVCVPDYVVHSDTELEHVRNQYFELAKEGKEQNCQMSKELRCRLLRNTMTSMVAILRAKGGPDSERYPSKLEVTTMAKRIIKYYPMLQDVKNKNPWVREMYPVDKEFPNFSVRDPQNSHIGSGDPIILFDSIPLVNIVKIADLKAFRSAIFTLFTSFVINI